MSCFTGSCKRNVPISLLATTHLGQPLHSQPALTILPSPNLALFLLLDTVYVISCSVMYLFCTDAIQSLLILRHSWLSNLINWNISPVSFHMYLRSNKYPPLPGNLLIIGKFVNSCVNSFLSARGNQEAVFTQPNPKAHS